MTKVVANALLSRIDHANKLQTQQEFPPLAANDFSCRPEVDYVVKREKRSRARNMHEVVQNSHREQTENKKINVDSKAAKCFPSK